MIRICISGLSASGKTSLGHRLAKELNLKHITKKSSTVYQKASAGFSGKEKLVQMAASRHAKGFDAEIKRLSASNDCVVTTWLGPWIVKSPTLRVWLYASEDERAQRRGRELHMPLAKARKLIREKDTLTIRNFKRIYGIDMNDRASFDLELNTERLTIEEMAALISMLALSRSKIKFR